MRITFLVMGVILIFTLIVGATIGVFNVGAGNELYEEQAYIQLLSIAESKADRVEDFLDNRKADAIFLSESEDVKNLFDEEVIEDVGLMAAKIKRIAESTRDEIEEYIRANPDMTIEELQNDKMFQKIAVQRVGETGYTVVGDYENMIVLFHNFPDRIGADLRKFESSTPLLWQQLLDLVEHGEGLGFYAREEDTGEIRNKYQHVFAINETTRDNVKLFIGATTYVDEYGGSIQLASNLDKDFKLFQQQKGYEDLIFIGPEGDVIWTAKQHNELGTNLVTGVYNESLLANVFDKVKKDLGVGVSDSEAYGPEDKLSLFVTAPVMGVDNITGKRELHGIVALKLDNERISELIATDVGLGDAGEVYIVNRDRNHITPLKFDGHSSAVSENIQGEGEVISSEGIENCFKDYNNYYFALRGEDVDEVEKVGMYLDYAEDSNVVLGAHQYILESGWCVIAEMDEDYFLEVTPRTNMDMAINMSVSIMLLLIVCLVLDSFFVIKKEGRVK